jgi:hypothetical protein
MQHPQVILELPLHTDPLTSRNMSTHPFDKIKKGENALFLVR